MNFALDDNGRFQLHSAPNGGWDLVVDEKMVFYCRTPVEAVRFMAEQLGHESPARGVAQVVEALEGVEKAIRSASEMAASMVVAKEIGKAMTAFAEPKEVDRKQIIKAMSLTLAGCTEAELRVRTDGKKFVAKAKAILAPWFKAYGIEDEQN
jgi:hypothetical protein